MGTPTRHGHDWSQVPVPARRLGPIAAVASTTAAAVKKTTTSAAQAPVAQVLPVELLHAFYQALPPYGVQHFAQTVQILFGPLEFGNRTTRQLVFTAAVPPGLVHVITDVKNFMLVPGAALGAPEQELGHYAILGLLRFVLIIGDRVPMMFDTTTPSPNWPATGAFNGLQTGWSILDERFGAQRTGGFAVYARPNQAIRMDLIPDDTPQFVTTRAGAHIHGFTVPEATFDEIFRKHR